MPETLYLIVNLVDRFFLCEDGAEARTVATRHRCHAHSLQVDDFVCISDRVYTDEQILRMEKIILHHLEWELNVPICYVFLVQFIKASIPDNEMEKNLIVVVSGEEVSSTKWYLEYLKPLVSKLDTPTDLSRHLALVSLILLI
ncbi:hypothetical protein Dimus_028656, partial [Dionaea muscipula]